MPQVSLYIDQEVLNKARRNASMKNVSLSKYVTEALAKDTESDWPKGYWDLFGALDDDTFVRPADQSFNQVSGQVVFP